MSRRQVIAAALLGVSLFPHTASAQEPASPKSAAEVAAGAEITPPRLKRDPCATYPEQALREPFYDTVAVKLIVDVDATGAVTGATVEAPQGHGFDEAAVTAAKSLVFDPALR